MTIDYPSQQGKASQEEEIHYDPTTAATAPVPVVVGTAVPVDNPTVVSIPAIAPSSAGGSPVVMGTAAVVAPTPVVMGVVTPVAPMGVQPVMMPPTTFKMSREPTQITCQYCHQNVVTRTKDEMTGTSWLMVGILVLCCWPCAWIPCVCNSCQDTQHFCPKCGRQVGLRVAMD